MSEVSRSVAVKLSANATAFVSEMRRAEQSVKSVATAAIGVRPAFAAMSTAADEFGRRLTTLGTNRGLTGVVRDVERLKAAMAGLSGSHELGAIGSALNALGAGGLSATTSDIRRIVSALNGVTAGTASGVRDLGVGLHGIGSVSLSGASTEITAMSSGIRRLIRDANSVPAIRALAQALRDLGAAGGGLGGLGNVGNSLRGMQSQIDQLRRSVAALRGAAGGGGSGGGSGGGLLGSLGGGGSLTRLAGYAAGYLAIGSAIKSTYQQTADYQTEIASFGAVTKTTGTQLQAVSDLALKLGADTTIAGASASNAAETMTELAKGGLSVKDSMTAAKGTLQLASAAGVDFATAAGIQTAALNEFALGADQAGKVADILASTAAAASGEVTDFAEGLKQSGTVAHGFGLSLLDNQTILAEFAQAGIKGSMAGNILKSMLLSVEAASGPASKALKDMGVQVKNSDGTYITAAQLQQQLADAKTRLGTAAFNADAKVAFGTRGIIGAGIAADQGSKGFDKMKGAIQNGAGAAAFSTAKMSGLGGAVLNMKNQVETAQVTLGQKFSPAVIAVTNTISKAIPTITGFLTGASLSGGLSSVGSFFKPLVDGAGDLVGKALPYVVQFGQKIGEVWTNILGGVKPVIDGIGKFFHGFADSGVIDIAGHALVGFEGAVAAIYKWLQPVGRVIGDVIGSLGGLPKPVWAGAAALGAFLLLRGPLNAMLLQLVFGYARLGTTLMGTFSGGLLAGIRGMGAGLLGVGRSMLAAFGGPVGIAIAGISAAIAFFVGKNQDAKAATEATQQAISDLEGTVNQTTGALTKATAVKIGQDWVTSGADKDFTALGVSAGTAAAAIVSGGETLDSFRAKLIATKPAQDAINDALGKASTSGAALTYYAKNAGVSIGEITAAAFKGGPALDAMAKKLAVNGVTSDVAASDLKNFAFRVGGTVPALSDLATATTNSGIASATAAALYKVSADASAALGEKSGGAAPKLTKLTGAAQDLDKASRRSADSSFNATAGIKSIGDAAGKSVAPVASAAAVFQNWAEHVSGVTKVNIDTSGYYTFETATSQAFATFNAASQAAQDEADLFWFHVAGPRATAQQAIDATAASLRAVGAAARDQGANNDAVTTAKAGVTAALAKPTGGDDGYTNAQKILDVAAARRALSAAEDTQAGSEANLRAAGVDAAELVDKQVVSTYQNVAATKGYTAGVKAATGEMKHERAEFIARYVAGKQSAMSDGERAKSLAGLTAEGGKAADALGLIPKNVKTNLDLLGAVKVDRDLEKVKTTAADAAKAKVVKFTTDTKDALSLLKVYHGSVTAMPKSVQTKFNADVKTAEDNGKTLYGVYNSTTRTWTGKFETAGQAQAQANAGDLVQKYDSASGTWTATLNVDSKAGQGSANSLEQDAIRATKNRMAKLGLDTNQAVGSANSLEHDAIAATQNRTGTLYLQADASAATATITAVNQQIADARIRAGSITVPLGNTGGLAAAHADGGTIYGGIPGRDSVLGLLMPGEEVIRTKQATKHRGLLKAINAGMDGFAVGGTVGGSSLGLSGRTAATLGDSQAAVVQALSGIRDVVSALRQTATDKHTAAADAGAKLREAQAAQINNPKDAAAKLRDAQKAVDAENSKTTARQRVADQARVDSAQRALDKIKATDALNVAKATREQQVAAKTSIAYGKAAAAAEAEQKRLQKRYQIQQTLAAQFDATTTKLAAAQDRLSSAKDALSTAQGNKASAADQITSSGTGFDGGLTGHSDTRNTFATFLAGQKYDVAQVAKIRAQAAALKAKGLNTQDITDATNAALGGDGTTLNVLAGASKAQIGQANKVSAAKGFQSGTLGNQLAGLQFDPSIKAAQAGVATAQGFVNGFESQLSAIQKSLNKGAGVVITALTSALKIKSPSQVMHVLGGHTAQGFANGIAAGSGAVSSAMTGLTNIPSASLYRTSFGSSSMPKIEVQVLLDGQRIDDKINVRVNGSIVALGNAASLASSRPVG